MSSTKRINDVYQTLNLARELGSPECLPKTYTRTTNSLTDAQQFIRQNPNERLRINQFSLASLFQAQRLYSLTKYVTHMQIAQEENLEQFALQHESQLIRINAAFDQPEHSNLTFNEQTVILEELATKSVGNIKECESDRHPKGSKAQRDKWKRKATLLQSEVRRLKEPLLKNSRCFSL